MHCPGRPPEVRYRGENVAKCLYFWGDKLDDKIQRGDWGLNYGRVVFNFFRGATSEK